MTANTSQNVLQTENLTLRLGDKTILSGVNLSVKAGEIVCLLGPSGSGKTSALRLIAGLEKPSDGRVTIENICVAGSDVFLPPEKRGTGYLFQDYSLFPHLTVAENVGFSLTDLSKSDRRKRVQELLEMVGMSAFSEASPHTLSGGEQQRVALVRALANAPKLILMDEPFSSLDPQLRGEMRDTIRDVLKLSGASALIVTHDASDALRLADRVAVLLDGELAQTTPSEDIFRAARNRDVVLLFGDINEQKICFENGLANSLVGEITQQQLPDGNYVLAIRPTDIYLNGGMNEASDNDGLTFQANLSIVRQVGSDWLCYLEMQDERLWEVSLRSAIRPIEGSRIFWIAKSAMMIFAAD
jgi:iron(III) transport system ATP-binding protein